MTGGIQVELMCLIVDQVAYGCLDGERFVVNRHFMTFRFLCRNHNDCNVARNQGRDCYAGKW